MKKFLVIFGIFVAFVAIATVSYTNIDSTKTYSMSFNDMKSVKGGDTMYEDHRCVTFSGGCQMGGCIDFGYRQCVPTTLLPNTCIQFSGGEQTCGGSGNCYWWDDYSGCTSYPN